MRKLRYAFFAVLTVLMSAAPVLAQAAAPDNASSEAKFGKIAAGFGEAVLGNGTPGESGAPRLLGAITR